jgi:hypothetical protein
MSRRSVVDAEITKRLVELVEQRLSRSVPNDNAASRRQSSLPGQDDGVTGADLVQQCSQHRLGATVAVDRGRVDQCSASVQEDIELLFGVDLID